MDSRTARFYTSQLMRTTVSQTVPCGRLMLSLVAAQLGCDSAGKEIPLEVALAAPLLDVAALYLSSIDKPECRDLSSKIELVIGLIRHRRAQTSPEDLLCSIRRLFASSSDARRRAVHVIQSALALVDKANAVPCEDCDPVADAVSSVLGLRAEALPLGTLESSVAAHLDELRLLSNGGNVPGISPIVRFLLLRVPS